MLTKIIVLGRHTQKSHHIADRAENKVNDCGTFLSSLLVVVILFLEIFCKPAPKFSKVRKRVPGLIYWNLTQKKP